MPPKLRTLEIVLPVDSARVRVPGADVPTRDVVQRKSKKKIHFWTWDQLQASWSTTWGTATTTSRPQPIPLCKYYIKNVFMWLQNYEYYNLHSDSRDPGQSTGTPRRRRANCSTLKRVLQFALRPVQKHSYYGVISRRTRSSDVLDKVQVFHVDGVQIAVLISVLLNEYCNLHSVPYKNRASTEWPHVVLVLLTACITKSTRKKPTTTQRDKY